MSFRTCENLKLTILVVHCEVGLPSTMAAESRSGKRPRLLSPKCPNCRPNVQTVTQMSKLSPVWPICQGGARGSCRPDVRFVNQMTDPSTK